MENPKHEILLLPEVAERLRVSTATVNRLLAERRKGTGTFPLPLSAYKGKGRWLASDVDGYIGHDHRLESIQIGMFRVGEKERQAVKEKHRSASDTDSGIGR